ncbi:MAG TPA: glycoside hydrolase family 2 TIM barrel-domain containing protein, partial [Candidatus Dormibacteraeota bacterium]|nr:glycoside hydrolase family 2 TIM barrel-domain containing protein [Candidatus Dormibacteraeota bacterium]
MRIPVFAFVLLAGTLRVQSSDLDGISLAGKWRFEIDSRDAGLRERWFARALKERIELPGALQNQGFGNDVGTNTEWTGAANVQTWLNGPQYAAYRKPGNIKVPFCLQPEKHYAGAAWYQRDIQVPAGWSDKRVVLFLERPHWETRVWLDGNEVDMCKSLSTPHIHELGFGIPPGKHALTIRVDNRRVVDVGSWAHSVTDNTQGNWNGIVGRIELAATSPVWIEDAQLYPNLARNSVVVKVKLGNATERPGSGTFIMAGKKFPVKWEAIGGAASFEVMFNRIKPWDEFHPELSKLVLQLKGSLDSRNSAQKSAPLEISDRQTFVSGFREISVQGKQILLNGRPIFLRGTLECCVFPLTGYPPTDVGPWKKIIQTCQAHGLNHIRFHSWCPPDAAFTAADELGFYLSIEAGVWANVGDDQPIDGWLQDETERILKAYGNHPSFLLMASGNEPGGKNVARYLGQWVNRCKQADPRRLFTSASGWPAIPENQYHVSQAPRGPKGWLGKDYRFEIESGRDKRDTVGTIDVPVVVHEMGQWCAYPDFAEISKFGGPLKPHNFEIFRDSLSENGMLDQDKDFARASGKLQALCYKEEIEAALRTPGIAGYQLLGLSDFPGQGTAPVGVLDCFWEPKGYITPEEFARFCGPTVPLARLFKRVWKSDETLSADIEVANYGPEPITKAVAECKLVADDG